MPDELADLSTFRAKPYDARLAEGDAGEAGDPVTKLRLFAGGSAEGGTGDSQKNDPRPGEPENAGETWTVEDRARADGLGESTSISEPDVDGRD